MFVTSQQKCNNSFTAPYHSCSDPVMGTFSNNCCNGSIECDKLSLDIKGKLIIYVIVRQYKNELVPVVSICLPIHDSHGK